MVSTVRVVNTLCTIALIAIFAMSGVMKLTPLLKPELHNEMKSNFQKFATIPPASLIYLQADVYRILVGVVELVCVACLACPHTKTQLAGHYVLVLIMLGAIWTHYYIGDTVEKMMPALVCLVLLLFRFYTCSKVSVKVKST